MNEHARKLQVREFELIWDSGNAGQSHQQTPHWHQQRWDFPLMWVCGLGTAWGVDKLMFQPLQPTLPVFSSSSAKLLCSYDALRDTNSFKTNNIIMLCWLVMSYYLLTWPSSVLIFLGKNAGKGYFSPVICHRTMFRREGCKSPMITVPDKRFWGNGDWGSFPFRAHLWLNYQKLCVFPSRA